MIEEQFPSQSSTSEESPNPWREMTDSVAESQEKISRQRQIRNQIITLFARSNGDNIDSNILVELGLLGAGQANDSEILVNPNPEPDQVEYDDVMRQLRKGNDIKEYSLLLNIPRPVDNDEAIQGIVNTINSDQSQSEASEDDTGLYKRRILYYYTIGSDIPQVPPATTVEQIKNFGVRHKTVSQFEQRGQSFIERVRKNDPQEVSKYQQAIEELKKDIFGEQYEFFQVLQELKQEAQENTPANAEVERSHEYHVKDDSLAVISKTQLLQGSPNNIYTPDLTIGENPSCEDAVLYVPEKGLYGVFDGAGGVSGGREASHAARDKITELSQQTEINDPLALAKMLDSASDAIIAADDSSTDKDKGYTTGAVAKIIDCGSYKRLIYASVGDSRIYVVREANGRVQQVTQDEGFENIILNALGQPRHSDGSGRTKQYDEIYVFTGDKVVICSDGVTGDSGSDLMSPEELGQIVRSAGNASEAAIQLVTKARKLDDRSAIVFQV